jgi:hypothetical protein
MEVPPEQTKPSLPDLELPVAPAFVSRPRSIPLDQMLDILEEYRQWFPALRTRPRRETERCLEEFIL